MTNRLFRRVNCRFSKEGTLDMGLSFDLVDHSGEGYNVEDWITACKATMIANVLQPDKWYLSYFVVMDIASVPDGK
jgi:hypothetical protein